MYAHQVYITFFSLKTDCCYIYTYIFLHMLLRKIKVIASNRIESGENTQASQISKGKPEQRKIVYVLKHKYLQSDRTDL